MEEKYLSGIYNIYNRCLFYVSEFARALNVLRMYNCFTTAQLDMQMCKCLSEKRSHTYIKGQTFCKRCIHAVLHILIKILPICWYNYVILKNVEKVVL
jgi:hypothetical protein